MVLVRLQENHDLPFFLKQRDLYIPVCMCGYVCIYICSQGALYIFLKINLPPLC